MEALRLGDVQETALIPLAIRASETKRKNARITDQKAVEIIEQLGVDTKKYDKYASHEGVVYRTVMIDREVKQTISRHPNAVCVNLGCGLDDRFTRVDNGKIRWFNVDLPDAIEVRRKVFADTERYQSIVGDVLDPEWIKRIPEAKETIVVAEGLFMYFTREQVQTILHSLTDNFPKGYLFVELMHPKMMNEKKHDTIKTTRAHFGWGTTSGKDLLPLDDKLNLVKEISISDEMKAAGGLSKLFGTIIGNLNNRLDVYSWG